MKKIILSMMILGSIFLFTGCAMDEVTNKYSPDNVERMLKRNMSGDSQSKFISTYEDKTIAKSFAKYYDRDRYQMDYTSDFFVIRKKLVYFSQNVYLGDADNYIERHSSDNEFSRKYKSLIRKRGNTYKVLKGSFNRRLWEIKTSQRVRKYNKQGHIIKATAVPAIAEFNRRGQLVSLMLNSVEIEAAYGKVNNPNVQSEINLKIAMLVDGALNRIRNNVSIRDWNDNLLYQSK